MRGILIDPFTKSVTEIETGGSIDEIYSLIDCELFTIVNLGDHDCLFLDDEGLLVPKEYQEYWSIAGSNQPYAGRGLILGADADGYTIGAYAPIDKVRSLVSFVDKETIDPVDYMNTQFFVMENGEWKEI